jgi:hypothetical protein
MTPIQITLAVLGLLQGVALFMMNSARADRVRRDDEVNRKLDDIGETMTTANNAIGVYGERLQNQKEKLDSHERQLGKIWERMDASSGSFPTLDRQSRG